MAPILRVVLDLLKPHDPPTLEFAERLADADGVYGVNATTIEVDKKVENVKLTIEGEDIRYETIRDLVDELGGTIHSVDQIACGERLIEEQGVPQDQLLR